AQTQFQPSIAYGAGTYFVAWTNDITSNGGQRDVYGALVSSAGVASAPFAVSTAANAQQQPNVAFGGGNFLVTFDDLRFNGSRDELLRHLGGRHVQLRQVRPANRVRPDGPAGDDGRGRPGSRPARRHRRGRRPAGVHRRLGPGPRYPLRDGAEPDLHPGRGL